MNKLLWILVLSGNLSLYVPVMAWHPYFDCPPLFRQLVDAIKSPGDIEDALQLIAEYGSFILQKAEEQSFTSELRCELKAAFETLVCTEIYSHLFSSQRITVAAAQKNVCTLLIALHEWMPQAFQWTPDELEKIHERGYNSLRMARDVVAADMKLAQSAAGEADTESAAMWQERVARYEMSYKMGNEFHEGMEKLLVSYVGTDNRF